MTKISVIIPVYNIEQYLRRCLDSICGQTFKDLEIICVNDNSTDCSGDILTEYAARDCRIRVLNNEVNLKAGPSRNKGLKVAVGEYIYFMDADDYIDENYLQELYENALKYDADITMNVNIMTDKAGKSDKYVHPSMPSIPHEGCFIDNEVAIDKSFCVIWMRLFRKHLLISNDVFFDPLEVRQDIIFNYIVNSYANKIFAFSGSAYHYIIRDDSLSGIAEKNNNRDLNTMKAYNIIYDYLLEHDLLKINRAKLFNVSPFYKVDTQEKFDLYKSYFEKIKEYLYAHKEQYNAMDLFFCSIISESRSFNDYKASYPQSVAMAFVKQGRKF